MALLIYNGVSLPYCNITRFSQKVVREHSDTDWYLTEFDIQADCIINSSYVQVFAAGNPNPLQNPADIMGVLRRLLFTPRKPLQVTFNGVNLIPGPAGVPGTVDAQNGPKPQTCDLIKLTDTTFILQYRVVAHYWEHGRISGNSPAVTNTPAGDVLTNRWKESIDIDEVGLSTRTREGKFVIRSDNASGLLADQIRTQMAVIGVPFGFLRDRSHYEVSEDGLTLSYRIVDREVFKSPPAPAFKAEGWFEESAPHQGGPIRYGTVHIKLYGPANSATGPLVQASQWQLVQTAIAVAMQKLRRGGAVEPKLITDASVRVGMYENWVEVHFKVQYNGGKPRLKLNIDLPSSGLRSIFGLLALWLDPGKTTPAFGDPGSGADNTKTALNPGITQTPFTNPIYIPTYTTRGSAELLIQAAAYYDPNFSVSDMKLIPRLPGIGNRLPFDNPVINTLGAPYQLGKGALPGTAGTTPEP